MNNKKLLAILYFQGEDGITLEQVKELFSLNTISEAKKLLQDFHRQFNEMDLGIKVVNFNEVYKLATRESVKDIITKLVSVTNNQRLSNAAIEVAGIVAYRQPITKGGINSIRGVASEQVVNTLLLKGIIEEVGVASTPGNPVLYGVTNKFYDYFKITSMRDLPKLNDFNYVEGLENEQSNFDLFSSQRED